jgi:hypothetical protein
VDTHVPCGHFSGGRGSWWNFHLLRYAAKEEPMNIRDAHEKPATDEQFKVHRQDGWVANFRPGA